MDARPGAPPPRIPHPALLAAAVIGLSARLVLSRWSYGTNDMVAWDTFARAAQARPLCFVYEHVTGMGGQFNHPPLMGLLGGALEALAAWLRWPFSALFKGVFVVADCMTALLLWRIGRAGRDGRGDLAAALFGLSLVSILISGFHGNTDALCAFFCLLAAFAMHERRELASGLAFAAALNVKLLPFAMAPALLVFLDSRRAVLRFAAGAALGLVPFLFPLASCGPVFLRKVVAYQPRVEHWGVPFLLILAEAPRALARYEVLGRQVVLGAIVLASLTCRFWLRGSVYAACAVAFALFLVLAPGFGVQYLVYVVPFLIITAPRLAACYCVLAGLFVLRVYLSALGPGPLFFVHLDGRFPLSVAYGGLPAWGCLVLFLGWYLHQAPARRPDAPPPRR